MDITYENFCDLLVEGDQEAEKLLSDTAAYHGEVLPHVFMGDWTRLLLNRYHVNSTYVMPANTCRLLERAFTGADLRLRDLVGASFVENIPRQGDGMAKRLLRDFPPTVGAHFLTVQSNR